MISIEDISQRIISLLAEVLDVNTNKINTESSIENTRGWDSLMTVLFIVSVEAEFDITIEMEDAEHFTSIERVTEILSKNYLE